jgi:uncharacterized protein
VFTPTHIVVGLLAALIVGLSKTAIPGGGLLATPLLATIVSGRLITGLTIPILILADFFAVRWYGHHQRRDVLRPLVVSVAFGFVLGTAFFAYIGKGGRSLDVTIALIILLMVSIQTFRLVRKSPAAKATPFVTNAVGVTGGFTTFVANAAGPVLNTYFTGLGLPKDELIGTSAIFYLAVNLAKIPVYLLIGRFLSGGAFFTAESLRFDVMTFPAVLVGVFAGRWLLPRIPQATFSIAVLILAAVAAMKLLAGV